MITTRALAGDLITLNFNYLTGRANASLLYLGVALILIGAILAVAVMRRPPLE